MLVGIDASRAVRPITTGTEAYSRYLIAALARRDEGNRYRLYVDHRPTVPLAVGARVETRVIRLPRLWTHLRLGVELARRPPDLLFVPSHVIPVVCPVPAVVTIHDVGYLWYRAAYRPAAWLLLHLGTLHNTRASKLIVVDSEATANDLVRFFAVPRQKIRVAYLGAPAVELIAQTTSAIRRPDLPERYFLFVGTLQRRKNLARLLRAFALVRQSNRGATVGLVIAGADGPGATSVRALADRLGIADAVRWLGYVPDAERRSLFAGAVAYVFPSLYEGFGLPILEAMAWGTAVISSNAASLPEVVGPAGLLVDPCDVGGLADAMLRILDDPALRSSLIVAGRARAGEFTWDRCAAIVEAAFGATASRGS